MIILFRTTEKMSAVSIEVLWWHIYRRLLLIHLGVYLFIHFTLFINNPIVDSDPTIIAYQFKSI